MSSEQPDDEAKLKETIIDVFKTTGFLAEVKAQIYEKLEQTLNEDLALNNTTENGPLNEWPKTQSLLSMEPYLQSIEGVTTLHLILDTLDRLGLKHSTRMLKLEIGDFETLYKYHNDEKIKKLIKNVAISSGESPANSKKPLLLQLVGEALKSFTTEQVSTETFIKSKEYSEDFSTLATSEISTEDVTSEETAGQS